MWIIRAFAVCTLFIAVCCPSLAAEKKSSGIATSNQIGRYQLIQGKLAYTNMFGEYVSTDAMYKLDTVTGKFYICYISQSSQLTERGTVINERTCVDFEKTWESVPQPARK